MEDSQETKKWCAAHFGIKEEEVLWYHGGICYDRIGVTTKEAANKVTEKVRGQTANGGWFDGMALGGQVEQSDGSYDVMC